MHQKLLNALFKKESYVVLAPHIRGEFFPSELRDFYDMLVECHEKYEGDIDFDEFRELFFARHVMTTSRRKALSNLLEDIKEEGPPDNLEMAIEIVRTVGTRELYREVAEHAIHIVNGVGEVEEHHNAILRALEGEEHGESGDAYDLDLDSLLAASDIHNRVPFRLPTLNDYVPGLGRGNLGIVFARPETGKSSFVASEVVGYMQRGLKVLYLGNEEPGHKIAMNVIRSMFVLDDLHIHKERANITEKWAEARKNFVLLDAVGMSMRDVVNAVVFHKPDAIVFDQADKIKVEGKFGGKHEQLKEIYVGLREIVKRHDCFAWAVSQASADAEGKRYLTFDMMDMSKTGKAGEADLIIGIGKDANMDDNGLRYINISKNKINGFHGAMTVSFDQHTNTWSA